MLLVTCQVTPHLSPWSPPLSFLSLLARLAVSRGPVLSLCPLCLRSLPDYYYHYYYCFYYYYYYYCFYSSLMTRDK